MRPPRHFFPAALAGAAAEMPAAAATCSTGKIDFAPWQGIPGTAGVALCDGPDEQQFIDAGAVFHGCILGEKIGVEGKGAERSGDGAVTFRSAPVTGDAAPGRAVDAPSGFARSILLLKQGPGFGAFHLAQTRPVQGSWSTSGPGRSRDKLSHGTLCYRDDGLIALRTASTLQPAATASGMSEASGKAGFIPTPTAASAPKACSPCHCRPRGGCRSRRWDCLGHLADGDNMLSS